MVRFSRKWKTYADWSKHAGGLLRHKKMTRTYFERVKKAHEKYPEGTLKQLRGKLPEKEWASDIDIREKFLS